MKKVVLTFLIVTAPSFIYPAPPPTPPHKENPLQLSDDERDELLLKHGLAILTNTGLILLNPHDIRGVKIKLIAVFTELYNFIDACVRSPLRLEAIIEQLESMNDEEFLQLIEQLNKKICAQ